MYDTQLNDFRTYSPSQIIYRMDSTTSNDFRKIKISYKNDDGTIGDFIFSAPENLFSYGIQELRNSEKQLLGYIMPIVLHKKNNPTPDELLFISKLQEIIEHAKQEVSKHVDEIDLKRFSPLFNHPHKAPVLYAKLLFNKKDNKVHTYFIDDPTHQEIDPLTLIQRKCFITCALKVESIFIGNKITIQIKIYEGIVRIIQPPRRLLLSQKPTEVIHEEEEEA